MTPQQIYDKVAKHLLTGQQRPITGHVPAKNDHPRDEQRLTGQTDKHVHAAADHDPGATEQEQGGRSAQSGKACA